MAEPLVSIIIPVHNGAKHLEHAIKSALEQSWINKEIIIVDDGSSDDSLAVAEKHSSGHLRIFHQANKGASAARNKGLAEARGAYIQFLDADDLLKADKIEKQMAELLKRDECISLGGTVHFWDDQDPFKKNDNSGKDELTDPVYFLQRLYGGVLVEKGFEGMIQPNAWLTPRVLIDKAGPWNEELTLDDDGEFFCRVVLQSKQVIYVGGAVNYYRKYRGNNNLSSRRVRQAMRSALMANELKFAHLTTACDDALTKRVFARVFKADAVTFYPEFKDLYLIAIRHVEQLGGSDFVPTLGGPITELIKNIFGWRAAKLLAYRFGRLRGLFKSNNYFF